MSNLQCVNSSVFTYSRTWRCVRTFRRFAGTYCLHLQSWGAPKPNNTTSHLGDPNRQNHQIVKNTAVVTSNTELPFVKYSKYMFYNYW